MICRVKRQDMDRARVVGRISEGLVLLLRTCMREEKQEGEKEAL